MTDYIAYLNLPTKAGIAIVALYAMLQLLGEILEIKGKTVPEIMKVRKYFARKKQERETLTEVRGTLAAVRKKLEEIDAHYSSDNISKRDTWITGVNQSLATLDSWRADVDKKLDDNNAITMDILVENLRGSVIGFASYVVDEKNMVTHEQFNRIFKIYSKYEAVLRANEMTNGEADTAMRIIRESYDDHLRNHTFLEDLRGYPSRGDQQ